jgi:adenylylsulfate kinase-like enzyme
MNASNAPIRAAQIPSAAVRSRIVWITGLSGAGKTTVAKSLKESLDSAGERVILLDGDELRAVLPLGNRFDAESRLALAMTYGRLCRLLCNQGFTVICATISMRREVYRWNRENLPNYVEVFLDTPVELRVARDPKRYYAALQRGELKDFAGHDQDAEFPEEPHLRLEPDKTHSPAEIAQRIVAYLQSPR